MILFRILFGMSVVVAAGSVNLSADVLLRICDPHHVPIAGAEVVSGNLEKTFISNDSGLISMDIHSAIRAGNMPGGASGGVQLLLHGGMLCMFNKQSPLLLKITLFTLKGEVIAASAPVVPQGYTPLAALVKMPLRSASFSVVEIRSKDGTAVVPPVMINPAGNGISKTRARSFLPGDRVAGSAPQSDTLSINREGFEPRSTVVTIPEGITGTVLDIMIKPKDAAVSERLMDTLSELYGWPRTASPRIWYILPGDSIQDIVDKAARYDVINVAEGTYFLERSVVLHAPVLFRSIAGPEVTIVDGQYKSRCFLMEVTSTVISGFTITHGDASGKNNWGSQGDESSCDDGGAVFTCGCFCSGYTSGSYPLIENCHIIGNRCGSMGGGGLHLKGGTVRNCLVAYNSAERYGGGIAVKQYEATIEQTTVTRNSTGMWFRQPTLKTTIKNSIIAGNVKANWDSESEALQIRLWHTLIEDEGRLTDFEDEFYDTISAIEADPMFTAPNDTNFTLQPNSPCIDAGSFMGDSVLLRFAKFDLAGQQRVFGSQIDIGAFEFTGK